MPFLVSRRGTGNFRSSKCCFGSEVGFPSGRRGNGNGVEGGKSRIVLCVWSWALGCYLLRASGDLETSKCESRLRKGEASPPRDLTPSCVAPVSTPDGVRPAHLGSPAEHLFLPGRMVCCPRERHPRLYSASQMLEQLGILLFRYFRIVFVNLFWINYRNTFIYTIHYNSLLKSVYVLLCACVLSLSVLPHSLHPVDCSPSGSSVGGVFQASILGWVAVSVSRGSSLHRDRTPQSCIGRWIPWTTREAPCVLYFIIIFKLSLFSFLLAPSKEMEMSICFSPKSRERRCNSFFVFWSWLTLVLFPGFSYCAFKPES